MRLRTLASQPLTPALARAAGIDPPSVVRGLFLGDSLFSAGPGDVSEAALGLCQYVMEEARGDGDCVIWTGDKWNIGLTGYARPAPVDPWHSGVPGNTIEAEAARYSALVDAIGQPEVCIISWGGNNVTLDDGPTLLAKVAAALAVLRAKSPSAWFVVISPVHYSNATIEAHRNALVAGYPALVAPLARVLFCDVRADADIVAGPDYATAEPSALAKQKAARALWGVMRREVLGPQTCRRWPRPTAGAPHYISSLERGSLAAASSLVFDGGATAESGLHFNSCAAMDTGANSWLMQMMIRCTTVPAGLHDIYTYGAGATTGGIAILQVGNAIRIYFNSGAGTIVDVACLRAATAHAIAIHYDRAQGWMTLWVDGTLRARTTGIAAATLSGGAHFFGQCGNAAGTAINGALRDWKLARSDKSSLVASFGTGIDGTTRRLRGYIEAYAAGLEAPPGLSAWVAFDEASGTTLHERVSATSSNVFGNLLAWSAPAAIAWPFDQPTT